MDSKRIIRAIIQATLVLCFCARTLAGTFGSFTFTDEGSSIKITGYSQTSFGAARIPATIDGKPVTDIGSSTFHSCSGLTSLFIPASVISIGGGAFRGCNNLFAIKVDAMNPAYSSADGVLFDRQKSKLIQYPGGETGSYTIPASVTAISYSAFATCNLTSVTIPASVRFIGDAAFYECKQLTSVTIPSGVTSIGESVFYKCIGMTSIDIPNSVTSIGNSAFVGCSGLTGIKIPIGVSSIGDYAFGSCSGLTSLIIPNSVTSIGDGAFTYCSGLTGITIPDSVTSIGDGAFQDCSRLTAITVGSLNSSYSSENGVLFDYQKTTLIRYPENKAANYTIPGSVIAIGDAAFKNCGRLTSLTIPDSVTSIGHGAFISCNGLTNINIPAGITSIEEYTFASCANLASLSIPNGVTSIGRSSFSSCRRLTRVIIPTSVTSIGDGAFGFSGLSNIIIPFGVTSIGDDVFAYCSGLSAVTIPDSVTSIGNRAFDSCTDLAGILIPDGVKSIGESAFYSCTGLTSINIPKRITSIGKRAFEGCTSLTGVILPSSVVFIGDSAFNYCSSLISAIFLGNAPTMGLSVFDNSAAAFTLYYVDGKAGFGSIGYPTGFQGGEIAINGPQGSNIRDGGTMSFGAIHLGQSVSRTFTIKNLGNEALTGLTIIRNGANAANFTVLQNPVAPLAAGGSTTFTVQFAPGSSGAKNAAIHIASNDESEGHFDILLTGTCIAPEIEVEQAESTSIRDAGSSRYGSVKVRSSKSQTYTIRNTGTARLTGIAVTLDGLNSGDFIVTTNPDTTLLPGHSSTMIVKFTPRAAGSRKAVIHVANNDADENPYDINLIGFGTTAVAPSAGALAFGSLSNLPTNASKTMITVYPADGLKYLTLTISKEPVTSDQQQVVEVSSNLVDWYSGKNHTTILHDNNLVLTVRDNTPMDVVTKRYIRLRKTR